jgi:hypothetical protein
MINQMILRGSAVAEGHSRKTYRKFPPKSALAI